ncbi:hypothetical protein [Halobacterium zhouii]|uniref:hypothetical protein n=1 Tax=Halobacterium zhouii TaxID=2902624 RepID=UPI001E39477F|nr:hypothetical protein [Halobacterium zhouii]
MSLEAYGVETPDVVREPADDRHDTDLKACPECGTVVGEPNTLKLDAPDVVDDVEIDTLVTRARKCDRHAYDVLLPVRVRRGAPSLGRSWTTVRVRLADQRVRPVAVPKSQVTRQ